MATTRIMPLHIGKGRTESTAISDIIDYVANPQKTDNGRLVTGYECDSRIADTEFVMAKRQYKGVRPVELPPADYVALIDELAKLRRSIDTMAARAADNKASALSPVEYYTLSSLTALTLQKIRLAALPQQYHLPEDMSHE